MVLKRDYQKEAQRTGLLQVGLNIYGNGEQHRVEQLHCPFQPWKATQVVVHFYGDKLSEVWRKGHGGAVVRDGGDRNAAKNACTRRSAQMAARPPRPSSFPTLGLWLRIQALACVTPEHLGAQRRPH